MRFGSRGLKLHLQFRILSLLLALAFLMCEKLFYVFLKQPNIVG